ncbi:AAA family ATPase [Streptomyces sp. NPDC001381]|uniref:helix-turn-helix transcriptional regulator n=1 Tax=Streptomyces sp. NPDC001381 TaxID=3364567 RepID=UPI0036BF31C2
MGGGAVCARPARTPATQRLLGRGEEQAALRGLIAGARAGTGGALVLYGEAGIGKTALLDGVHSDHRALRVLRVDGTQTEAELSFAGLQHLTGPLLRHFGGLPQPQREALGVALGRRSGQAPDPLHLGLAVLGLLAAAAEEEPVICLVDDAHWMDRRSLAVLAFAARRVTTGRIAFVITAEGTEHLAELTGLPARAVSPLSDRDARELLDGALRAPLDQRVRERVLSEAHGNPLALIHLPRWIGPTEMAARSTAPGVRAPKRLEDTFRARLSQLPPDVRRFLLLAAAEPDGNPLLVRRAAELMRMGPDVAATAESAGILDVGTRVCFRHPLLRSLVYAEASATERRRAHAALAACGDAVQDSDRHAWHRGQAAAGFDEKAAGRLEDAARRAARSAGMAVAGGFWELAAALTADRRTRAARLLSAARAKRETGAFQEALAILASLRHEPMPDPDRARVAVMHARTVYAVRRNDEAVESLLDAAHQVAGHDPAAGRRLLLDAFGALSFAGRYVSPDRRRDIVAQTRRLGRAVDPDEPVATLLAALIASCANSPDAVPSMARAVRTCRGDSGTRLLADPGVVQLVCSAALHTWDAEAWLHLVDRHVRGARTTGDPAALPIALNHRAMADIHAGRLDDAAEHVAQAHGITEANGTAPLRYADLALAAWRGDEPRTASLADRATREAAERREGRLHTATEYALAVLHNAAGRPEAALAAVGELREGTGAGYWGLLAAERVEAAAACGLTASARSACDMLRDDARACDTPWARGMSLRARALVEPGPAAEALFRQATEELSAAGAVLQTARTQLLWGEWLLTSGRRTQAREPLRRAWTAFTSAGAHALRLRAAGRLQAAGERTVRPGSGVQTLTAQELRVARMVARGETSREVGTALFVSPRTVDAHVRSILRKLEVPSRRHLRHVEGLRPTDRTGA